MVGATAMCVTETTASGNEYKVKDIAEADFGRMEITLAEEEMPGTWHYSHHNITQIGL